ncbi:mitochondrial group I intron splicing factor CCM1 [Metschnikowia bicuspidata var. bicuspidata NRRL YB-4993]|uniref:Mitochondrial 15S rRNA processing factor CCM1 n=1 Tax=Metschnikowia bicuspidata var. bicuspidata NRRL YB-4993 TaxID=869754 RepID=A0A1A0H8T7_9ASCO|nr:mitochondrial group I intron splicing factor CCM1 [Metschnikowia bicuspidata var. bicuspidata NRRL YB-4993]OBA20534.1 mitochondrial group I intron splicing factor CCM1 [Metschnikowia bicuspidata var. bicuspidata NRRL YB-4993]
MNLQPTYGLVRSYSSQIILKRTIFVLSADRKRRTKTKKENHKRSTEVESVKRKYKEKSELSHEYRELRNLASSVSEYVSNRKFRDSKGPAEVTDAIPRHERHHENQGQSQEELDKLPENRVVDFDPKSASLLTPAVGIPTSFKTKLGPAVKYLVTKEYQNWVFAFKQIEAKGGFKDIPEVDIRKLIYSIPKHQLVIVFPQIERLLLDAGVQKSPKVVNAYLKGLIAGGEISNERVALVEHYVQEMRSLSKNESLSRETYEILIEAYGKSKRIESMENIIGEMKKRGLKPSSNVYTNVMSTCVYKTKDHKQAVQLFDLMKFLAGNMAPGVNQYQDIIVSYVNNKDIEKALDLFEEMRTRGLPVNQKILVALARGCMTRQLLKLKAWDFIFEIYERQWEPTVPTLEYMVYLAAKDGDLPLARALYQSLNLLGSVTPRSFSFLMLAYSKSGTSTDNLIYKVPSILVHESGRNFRRNILDTADYSPRFSNPKKSIPFLPLIELSSTSEFMSESSAIMAHTLLMNPNLISGESINMFLDIAAKLGSIKDFVDRYDEFTCFDTSGVPATRIVESLHPENDHEHQNKHETNLDLCVESVTEDTTLNTKSPILDLSRSKQFLQFPRTTRTYIIALNAAAKNKDYGFSQKVWQERGNYRKSSHFRSLSALERTKSDFAFAASMVSCLTKLGLLDDALAILVSTEYQFKWTWKELRHLHTAAVNIGHDKVSKIVRGVAQRAQEKFEGKIKKKDFKLYALGRNQ